MNKRKKLLYIGFTVLFVIIFITSFNPYKFALDCIHTKHYKVANITASVFQNFKNDKSKWYSLNGYTAFKMKKYTESIKYYDKAYLSATDDYGAMDFDNKIYIKYYIKDFKSALEDFDDEIQNTVEEGKLNSLLWDKAQFLYNIKRYNESLEIYNKLIIESFDDEIYLIKNRLYYERAQVYDKLGKKELANNDRKMAEKLNIEQSFKTPIPEPVLLLNEEY